MNTQAVVQDSKANWLAPISLALGIGSFFFSPLFVILLGFLQMETIWEWYFSPFYEDIHGIIFYLPLSFLLGIPAVITGYRSRKHKPAGRNIMGVIGTDLGWLCIIFNAILLLFFLLS